jgi:hypothetical protein
MRALILTLLIAAVPAVVKGQFVDVTPTLVLPSMSGPEIFNYYCVSCHGRDGRGNGPVASALLTKPPDLRGLSARNNGTFPTDRVRTLLTGGLPPPAHGASDMPVWGPIFQALDGTDDRARARVENLIDYLISIQPR